MMGMGMVMSPEDQKKVAEKVEARKQQVRESLIAAGIEPQEDACGCGHDHEHDHHDEEEEDALPEIDEELVLTYIRTRQEAIDKARRKARSLKADVTHLENQLKVSENKVKALQNALAKTREELKALKEAQAQAAPEA